MERGNFDREIVENRADFLWNDCSERLCRTAGKLANSGTEHVIKPARKIRKLLEGNGLWMDFGFRGRACGSISRAGHASRFSRCILAPQTRFL
jgi:hypothetical protein